MLFERLGVGGGGDQTARLTTLLEEWAEVALRTLVWAKRELPQFEATAVELLHTHTGARWLHLATDDTNNVFNVAFRTAPHRGA